MAKIIPSVKRAFDILGLFLGGEQSVSVPQITKTLGMPRTTAHDLVNTLLESGYLERDGTLSNHFRLGLRAFELGSVYASRLDITEEGLHVARKITQACDETVQVAILDGTDAVFIIRVDSSRALRLVSEVGSRLYAHCTAVGKMLLSGLTDEELAMLYKGQHRLTSMTTNSISTFTDLMKELTMIRERGYAYDNCESNEDAICVAAPIYNIASRMCAAISITVPVTRMKKSRKKSLLTMVQQGAEDLTRKMGGGSNIKAVARHLY
jgi:IclR family transcriptional regulator, KDG regulon repressor